VESIVVSEWNAADLQAFMDVEWPRHDEPRGIRWVAHDVLLVARNDEEPIGAARHKIRLDTAEYQARPFYERHGYACVATLANDRFGKALFIMEKRLA
jgi:hypothetical protein